MLIFKLNNHFQTKRGKLQKNNVAREEAVIVAFVWICIWHICCQYYTIARFAFFIIDMIAYICNILFLHITTVIQQMEAQINDLIKDSDLKYRFYETFMDNDKQKVNHGITWDLNDDLHAQVLDKIRHAEANSCPEILKSFRMLLVDLRKQGNIPDINAFPKTMDLIGFKLREIQHSTKKAAGWRYFWQIIYICNFDDMMNSQKFDIIRWFNSMKSQLKHIAKELYYLVFDAIGADKSIEFKTIKAIWSNVPEKDGIMHECMIMIIYSNHKIDNHQRINLFREYFSILTNNILLGAVVNLDVYLLRSVFLSVMYLSHPINLNDLHVLYVGAIISKNELAQTVLESTNMISKNMNYIKNVYDQVDNASPGKSNPLVDTYDEEQRKMIFNIKSIVSRSIEYPGEVNIHQALIPYYDKPLAYGIIYYLWCTPERGLTKEQLTQCLDIWINYFKESCHYQDNVYILEIEKSWKCFINPRVLKHLDIEKVLQVFSWMFQRLGIESFTIEAYNYYLEAFLDRDLSYEFVQQLVHQFISISDDKINGKTISLWFNYLKRAIPNPHTAKDIFKKTLTSQVKINILTFRVIVQVFFQYNLFTF